MILISFSNKRNSNLRISLLKWKLDSTWKMGWESNISGRNDFGLILNLRSGKGQMTTNESPNLTFLITGLGSIGKRHFKNLIALSAGNVEVYHEKAKKKSALERQYSVKTYYSLVYLSATGGNSPH